MSWLVSRSCSKTPEQAPEVRVVERRLDLVEDVERARPGLEDRGQQRDRRERPLAARQQRQSLDLLAGRPHRDLDAGRERDRRGSVSEMLPVPPGKRIGNTSPNAALRVLERREEDRLHPLVELVDDRQQVLAGLGEVGELLGQELVPLLERRELLERERIDATELRELALGLLQSSPLLARSNGTVSAAACALRASGACPASSAARNRLIRTIFRNENILVESELGRDALEQARRRAAASRGSAARGRGRSR